MTAARAVGCALAFIILAACSTSRERERVDFERMRVQQRYELYGSSRVFADSMSMQHAPAGTVSRESGPHESDSALATLTAIPVPVTPALLARGRDRFTIYCAVCHGEAGFGGSLVAENMGTPRPPSLRSGEHAGHPVGDLFRVVTHGKGRMPPYAPQLTVADRWAVVAYVRALRTTPATTPAAIADSLRAERIHMIDSTIAARSRR